MYCAGNPVLYKDPSGHYAWSGSTDLDLTETVDNQLVNANLTNVQKNEIKTTVANSIRGAQYRGNTIQGNNSDIADKVARHEVTTVSIIDGNLPDNSTYDGMYGRQITFYRNENNNIITDEVKVRWEQRHQGAGELDWEHPAEPMDNRHIQYTGVGTFDHDVNDHTEPGISFHTFGTYIEGCSTVSNTSVGQSIYDAVEEKARDIYDAGMTAPTDGVSHSMVTIDARSNNEKVNKPLPYDLD